MKKVRALDNVRFKSYNNLLLMAGEEAEVSNEAADKAKELGLVEIIGDAENQSAEGGEETDLEQGNETEAQE